MILVLTCFMEKKGLISAKLEVKNRDDPGDNQLCFMRIDWKH